ncbi:MAG: DUF2156 domain-containing protein [Spirochaetales bacterium]|nr:DUF2156 domain-containing protein [Spirochaetales bacterium]
MRDELHPCFSGLSDGISEFTFANIYLFRKKNSFQIAELEQGKYIITGKRNNESFFLLPFGIPEKSMLEEMFDRYSLLKLVSEPQTRMLREYGYHVKEDRDNFDYIYLREHLAELEGRKYHKKRNLINAFLNNYNYTGKRIKADNVGDALRVLDLWRESREEDGDYAGAKEALYHIEDLKLCGSIVYVDGNPAAYTLGEELQGGTCFAIHFEKAIGEYKGLYQFINKCFASFLPEKYKTINREQDMGDEGLRQAKMSYRPVGFIKKYRVTRTVQ